MNENIYHPETLEQILKRTGDSCQTLVTGAKQVFPSKESSTYFHLKDWAVSSSGSGPSLILIPRVTRLKPEEYLRLSVEQQQQYVDEVLNNASDADPGL